MASEGAPDKLEGDVRRKDSLKEQMEKAGKLVHVLLKKGILKRHMKEEKEAALNMRNKSGNGFLADICITNRN